MIEAGDVAALDALIEHHGLLPAGLAYELLYAAAGEIPSAQQALDAAERRLGLDGVLELQGPSRVSLSGEETADQLAQMSAALLRGDSGDGRHYHDAYLLALLAEAAGSLSASLTVDALEDQGRVTDNPELWDGMLDDARTAAMGLWVARNAPDTPDAPDETEEETGETDEDATETDQ
jgi:hypothetical protein